MTPHVRRRFSSGRFTFADARNIRIRRVCMRAVRRHDACRQDAGKAMRGRWGSSSAGSAGTGGGTGGTTSCGVSGRRVDGDAAVRHGSSYGGRALGFLYGRRAFADDDDRHHGRFKDRRLRDDGRAGGDFQRRGGRCERVRHGDADKGGCDKDEFHVFCDVHFSSPFR